MTTPTTTPKGKTKRKAKPAEAEARYAGNGFLRNWTRTYDEAMRQLEREGKAG